MPLPALSNPLLVALGPMLLLGALVSGCGPRTVEPPRPDGSPFVPSTGECVVARQRIGCCVSFVPATRAEVLSDPCISAPDVSEDDAANCIVPTACIVQCPPQRPPSRAARMLDGRCVFADECATDSDCTVAENCYDCCCPDAVSEPIARKDACLFVEDEAHNDCFTPCPTACDATPGSVPTTSARCALVDVPHGQIWACVPGP